MVENSFSISMCDRPVKKVQGNPKKQQKSRLIMSEDEIKKSCKRFLKQQNILPDKRAKNRLVKILSSSLKENHNGARNSQSDFLTSDPFFMLKAWQLRSKVYAEIGYDAQFSEEIPGINFDDYDERSLTLQYVYNEQIIGTLRIIVDDLQKGLQSDKVYSLDQFRARRRKIGEISRVIVDKKFRGKGIASALLEKALDVSKQNGFDALIVASLTQHIPMYSQHSYSHNIIYRGDYGEIKADCSIYEISTQKKHKEELLAA